MRFNRRSKGGAQSEHRPKAQGHADQHDRNSKKETGAGPAARKEEFREPTENGRGGDAGPYGDEIKVAGALIADGLAFAARGIPDDQPDFIAEPEGGYKDQHYNIKSHPVILHEMNLFVRQLRGMVISVPEVLVSSIRMD